LEMALGTLPVLPKAVGLVVRTDAAGATQDFLAYVRQTGAQFSVSFAVNEAVRKAIRALNTDEWVPARRQNGEIREGAAVAEITNSPWISLDGYPQGSRLLVRREPLHPGAQQTLFDIPGARFTAFLTDQPDPPADLAAYAPHDHDPLDDALASNTLAGDGTAGGGQPGGLAGLDLAHREHAHVEDGIRGAKDSGARNLPCETFERNAVWLQLVMMAQTLMAWTQALTLDGELRGWLSRRRCATSCCILPPGSAVQGARCGCVSSTTGPGPHNSWPRSTGCGRYPCPPPEARANPACPVTTRQSQPTRGPAAASACANT
jgi:hypothetical protein